jgi:hypothetical protein
MLSAQTSTKQEKQKLSLAELRTAIVDAVGGEIRGIHSVLISTDELFIPRFDNGVSFRVLEQSNTVFSSDSALMEQNT